MWTSQICPGHEEALLEDLSRAECEAACKSNEKCLYVVHGSCRLDTDGDWMTTFYTTLDCSLSNDRCYLYNSRPYRCKPSNEMEYMESYFKNGKFTGS